MHENPIHDRITALDARTPAETSRLLVRVHLASWPGGGDRSEPGALGWIRRWRPERSGATIPTCSCAAGLCAVCN